MKKMIFLKVKNSYNKKLVTWLDLNLQVALWSDIFKHEDHFDENNIFKSLKEDINSSSEKISFSLLYNTDGTVNIEILKKLLKDLEFLV